MASSFTLPATPGESVATKEVIEDLYHDLREQLKRGDDQPVVPFTVANVVGEAGIKLLKERLEVAFAANFQMDIDLIANTVKALPVYPQTPYATSPASSKGSQKSASKKNQNKVPRPPNAFIIYRKDWHPKIVSENPGVHNNAISVIIGNKWRAESQAVKDEYKMKADMAKEQHASLHPNYQYQPRKPSEKKKRMTKNKLAKLATAVVDTQSAEPRFDFNDMPGFATFEAASDPNNALTSQISDWNAGIQFSPQPAGLPAFGAAPMADNYNPADVEGFPVPVETPGAELYHAAWPEVLNIATESNITLWDTVDTSVPGPNFKGATEYFHFAHPDPTVEAQRQAKLYDEMSGFFDFDAMVEDVVNKPSSVNDTASNDGNTGYDAITSALGPNFSV